MSEEFQRLSPEERQAYYLALEADLALVMKTVKAPLSTGLRDVQLYIDVGEYGLAFDLLLWQIAEAQIGISKDAGDALNRLRRRMSPLDSEYEAKFQEVMKRTARHR
jgi:hypothetical protein